MNTNIYFRGDAERGAEIIEILKSEGGRDENHIKGTDPKCLYFIRVDGMIDWCEDTSLLGLELTANRCRTELMDLTESKMEKLWRRLGFIEKLEEADIRIVAVKRPTLRSVKIGFYIADDLDAKSTPMSEHKTEYAVGEEFQCGLVRLKVEKGTYCRDCFFKGECNHRIVGPCSPDERKDGTSVNFKKVE